MRAKLKQKYHNLVDKFSSSKQPPVSPVKEAQIIPRQCDSININSESNVRNIDVNQQIKNCKTITFKDSHDPPPINLRLVNDYDENSQFKKIPSQNKEAVYTIVHQVQITEYTPKMKECINPQNRHKRNRSKQVSNLIMLHDSVNNPFRKASKYESLQFQTHRMDIEMKLNLQIVQLEASVQEFEWLLEAESNEQVNLLKQLEFISLQQSQIPDQQMPQICQRNNKINIENQNDLRQSQYYQMLLEKVISLIKEEEYLQDHLEILQTKLDPQISLLIECRDSDLQEVKQRKQLIRNHSQTIQNQIKEMISQRNFMIIQSSQITIENQIDEHMELLEQKYPIIPYFSATQLQQLEQILNLFLMNNKQICDDKKQPILKYSISENQMEPFHQVQNSTLSQTQILQFTTDNSSVPSDKVEKLINRPQLNENWLTPQTGLVEEICFSPGILDLFKGRSAGLKGSLMILDLQEDKKSMVNRYKDKTSLLDSTHQQKVKEIQEQKDRLELDNASYHKNHHQDCDQILENRFRMVKLRKQAIIDQDHYETQLRAELNMLQEKIDWMSKIQSRGR